MLPFSCRLAVVPTPRAVAHRAGGRCYVVRHCCSVVHCFEVCGVVSDKIVRLGCFTSLPRRHPATPASW
jgi:hypothetical protein